MRNIIRRATYSVLCAVEHKTDAATGEHGDLLDIIRERLALDDFRDVANEARRFLNLPRSTSAPPSKPARPAVRRGSREAARRLFAISRPIEGTLTEHYLQRRGIAHVHHGDSLRHQARCYYFGPDDEEPPEIWPAMIACVTNVDGIITGGHRTWLDPEGFGPNRLGKAPIETPRRAMGDLLGNAVRFGVANDVLVAAGGLPAKSSLPVPAQSASPDRVEPMAFWRAIGRQAVRPGNGYGHGYFPPALRAFASRNKIAATCAILRCRSGPALPLRPCRLKRTRRCGFWSGPPAVR
jgi:hypothetical protein